MSEPVPTHVGPYRVIRVLAQGGMSVVYEVSDPETGRVLAAKVLTDQGQGIPRFGREYRALASLDHPNVVRVFHYGRTDEGQPFLVMERVYGVPAQVRVKSLGRPGDPARTAEAARITSRVAQALDYLHPRGIVHRDLKSSNVLVLGDGQVKVLDFGTARLLNTTEELTDPGEFVGTFHYASPEQLTGQEVTGRSDLYALGELFYRMLTGRRPFESDDPPTLARMHLDVVPEPPRTLLAAIPQPLSALTMGLLAKRPGDRPESAARVIDALRSHLPAADGRSAAAPSLRGIGRGPQLRAIHDLLDRPVAGAALFFTGAEGSGRRRLVAQALEEARTRNSRTFEVPFGAHARPLSALVEAVAGTLADARPPDARPPDADLLTRVLAARAAADARPVVIGIAALEAGTDADVDALLRALARLHDAGAAVLAFAAWPERPLPRTWAGARTVPVPPLTDTEVAVLVSQWLGVSSVPPELVRRLLGASGGMPSALEALVRALPKQREERDAPFVVPAQLRDVLLIRLESLSRLHRRAAEALSLAEGDLEVAQVAHAIDETETDTGAALDSLVADQLLVERAGRWSFRMGLAATLLGERMRPTRRHLLCRRIAETVHGAVPSPRIARVRLEAGLLDEAEASAVAWAGPLVRAGLYAEALPLLERVATARGNATRDSLLWGLYTECVIEVRPEAAATDRVVARARALAAHVGDVGDADLMAARLARGRRDTTQERALLTRAALRLGEAGDRARSGLASERLAELDALTGALESGRRHALAACNRLRGADGRRASLSLGTILAQSGELRLAETTLREVLTAVDTDEVTAWRAAGEMADVLRMQGRFTEARERVEGLLPTARTQAPAPVFAGLLLAAAALDLDLFRVGQARERLAQASDVLADRAPAALDASLALLAARVAMLAGDTAGAARALDPALERARSGQLHLLTARLRGSRALVDLRDWGAAGSQELDEARALLREAGAQPALAALSIARAELDPGRDDPDVLFADVRDWMEAQPARVARLEHALAGMRFADRAGDVDRADALRRQAEAGLLQIRALIGVEDDASLGVHPWPQILRWG